MIQSRNPQPGTYNFHTGAWDLSTSRLIFSANLKRPLVNNSRIANQRTAMTIAALRHLPVSIAAVFWMSSSVTPKKRLLSKLVICRPTKPWQQTELPKITWIERDWLKHEGALYNEVFPGKIEAHLSVTVKVRGSNSKWRTIWIQER